MKGFYYYLILVGCMLLVACSTDPNKEYYEYRIDILEDAESPFDCLGEEREILVRLYRHKIIDAVPTNDYEYISPEGVYILLEGSQFVLDKHTDSTYTITAKENLEDKVKTGKFLVNFTDLLTGLSAGRLVDLKQDPVGTNAPFRIVVDQPETDFPKEGGVFEIPFVCQKQIMDDDKTNAKQWENTPLVGLYYGKGTNAYHTYEVIKREKVGEYMLKVTAKPYYFQKKDTKLISFFSIYNSTTNVIYYRIDFTQPEDRTISDLPVERYDGSTGALTE